MSESFPNTGNDPRITRKADGLDHFLDRRQPEVEATHIDRTATRFQPPIEIQYDRIEPIFDQGVFLSVPGIKDKPPPDFPQSRDVFLEPVRLDATGLGYFGVDR